MKDDPRVTKVGKFIRRTSIDELPQLVNIIKGDMSLVGPRPLPTYENDDLNEYQKQRLVVKPGLTCYWQCSGRNNIDFDDWIELDLKYIREASLWVDFKIILMTFKAVFGTDGAY
jgi:lipopolysaccharide/colanic/teichoic acid biosynthesis glycosyltransferase